jgi:predicted SnoaL-like aldol condensation-catalyzing enzyme
MGGDMNRSACVLGALLLCGLAQAFAQGVPPSPAPDQLAMLKSDDPKLARNKQTVFDFWRICYEGGHMDKVPDYLTPEYIQHNPNVKSGRDTWIKLFSEVRKPKPVAPLIKVPVISIVAERDIVMVSFVRRVRDRVHPQSIYEMTWFDVFRIDEKSGKIAEHWDSSERWGADGRPPGAEFMPQ